MKNNEFIIATDTSANLPHFFIKSEDIRIIPYTFTCNEETEMICYNVEDFDIHSFYDKMRKGMKVSTSQVNPFAYEEFFDSLLSEEKDVLFISMSSGISNSFNSATIGAEVAKKKHPDRKLLLMDSLGASLGEGLLVNDAAAYRAEGLNIDEVYSIIYDSRYSMCQVFTVDNLNYLRNTGRLSRAKAVIGSILNIKPVLIGDNDGKIVSIAKIRGLDKVVEGLAKKLFDFITDAKDQIIGIAHADAPEYAKKLKNIIMEKITPKNFWIVDYEPVTGSHVGPGALALFFKGKKEFRKL